MYCETCLKFAQTYAHKLRRNVFAQTYCWLKRIVGSNVLSPMFLAKVLLSCLLSVHTSTNNCPA